METTSTTIVDIATAATSEANAVVEDLLRRDQGMFDSAEVLALLDLVDTAVALATEADADKLATLTEVAAAGRAKAGTQPLLDAAATKGGLLLDLWAGLESLR
jgi:phosphoglycerate dehydrogenase-like enzyme